MAIQMLLFIGEPYGYGEEREYLPFRVRQMIDLGYLHERNHIETLYTTTNGVAMKSRVDLYAPLLDLPVINDDTANRNPLYALSCELVLKSLRKDVRKRGYENYEMAINAIETCSKHYSETQVVLFMR